MSHIVILGTRPRSLINFRGDLISTLIQAGHKVTAMSAPAETEIVTGVEELGASFRSYPVHRRGLSPVRDLRTLLALRRAFEELKPDIVLAYTIKPVIWGGLALRSKRKTKFFALITGLGFAFQGHSPTRKILTVLVTGLYRAALSKSQAVIFQNPDNRHLFLRRSIADSQKCHVLPGSGVNTQRFAQMPIPSSDPIFLSIGRLLGEKGFREFVQAARLVKEEHPQAKFQILGPADTSLDGICWQEIHEWEARGVVEYLGMSNDVRPYLAACHVYVLASYYGEGLPRTIIEAMAVGRPIITTDNVGCRETVVHGKNGFLIPVKDAYALAERMSWFIEYPEQIENMGRESREMVVERFDVHKINKQMFEIMGISS